MEYTLNCYRKGLFYAKHPLVTGKDEVTALIVLSVWTVKKKHCYLFAERMQTGEFCGVRLKTLLEATIRFQEASNRLSDPKVFFFQRAEEDYKALKPRNLEDCLRDKKIFRKPIPEGLLQYSGLFCVPTLFILTVLERQDALRKS